MSAARRKATISKSSKRLASLRARAEASLRSRETDIARMPAQDVQRLVHELQVHQIELEMKNEELRHTQTELAHARDRFADLYDFAPVAYLTLDASANIVEANLTASTLLGVARHRLVGEQFARLVAPEAQHDFYQYQRAMLDTEAALGCDLILRRGDGSTFAARMESIRIADAATLARLWRCVLSDISARKRTEQALRAREAEVERLNAELGRRIGERSAQLAEQRARLRAIVDTAAEGIITIDADGVVDAINAAALAMFGYRAEEVLGHNISVLMPPAEGAAHDGYIKRYLQTGEARVVGSTRSVIGRHKEGHLIDLELSLNEVVLPGVHWFVGVLRDLSEKRRLETQLRERLEDAAQLHRLRTAGELAGVLAHQLNQPLAAILSFAEAAGARVRRLELNRDQLTRAFSEIAQQANRAAQIIRDLRQFLSRERGEAMLENVNSTVQRAYELMRVLAHDSGIELRLDLCEPLPPVPMHKSQIEQVLLILIDNAIDAILEQKSPGDARAAVKGTISVCTALAERGEAVVVTVRDSGPGLDEKTSLKAFDPLYTTKINGIGLGLSIARSVVEVHRGRIWADPGPGGVFHFKLPVTH